MNLVEESPLISVGYRLDTASEKFGELQDSTDLLGDAPVLRAKIEQDGYLFLRGFLRRDDVMAARRFIVERLAEDGMLEPGTDVVDAISRAIPANRPPEWIWNATGLDVPVHINNDSPFRPDLAADNPALQQLLYTGRVMNFYREFFGEEVRHYDFTWLRSMAYGKGTQPHCDVVYMGRGTREKLLTAWVPLGDAPLHVGGLMILEGSNRKHEILRPYLERDVDTYCTNGRHAEAIETGKKGWEWNGSLSKNPVTLQQKLGGRWLTTEFEAGDLLTFTMHTVHASIDNKSDRIRLSSDSRYQPASLPADERWIGEKPIGHSLAGKRSRIC